MEFRFLVFKVQSIPLLLYEINGGVSVNRSALPYH